MSPEWGGGAIPGGGYPGGGGSNPPDGKKVLQQIAQETGGRFYQVSHFHPLDKIYADIEEDLRNQYSIGFTPDQPGEPGLYHHIHLTAKKKKEILVVQSRAGYYATQLDVAPGRQLSLPRPHSCRRLSGAAPAPPQKAFSTPAPYPRPPPPVSIANPR